MTSETWNTRSQPIEAPSGLTDGPQECPSGGFRLSEEESHPKPISSRELILRCGQDPDEPLGQIEFPSEMRQRPPEAPSGLVERLRLEYAAPNSIKAVMKEAATALTTLQTSLDQVTSILRELRTELDQIDEVHWTQRMFELVEAIDRQYPASDKL